MKLTLNVQVEFDLSDESVQKIMDLFVNRLEPIEEEMQSILEDAVCEVICGTEEEDNYGVTLFETGVKVQKA